MESISVRSKANPNSWCQEIKKLIGHQETRESARKSPGNYLNSAGNLVYLRLRFSGEPQEEKNIINFFFPSDFFFWKSQEKSRFFDVFTVKLCIIIRYLPGKYLNLIRNQDQEFNLRAPGIRVCLGLDPRVMMYRSYSFQKRSAGHLWATSSCTSGVE